MEDRARARLNIITRNATRRDKEVDDLKALVDLLVKRVNVLENALSSVAGSLSVVKARERAGEALKGQGG